MELRKPALPSRQRTPRRPFRTETQTGPSVFVAYGDGPARPVINGRVVGPFELADMRRREVLERDFNDAMRRRALHLRTGNLAAYRKADEQADKYLQLIADGIAAHRWEK
jgi:transposase